MARCLIIGCGCRGRLLARELQASGHAVRGTTRDPARLSALLDAGVEPRLGDPDRVATVAPALENVTVACVMLGSASGDAAAVAALHGPRLAMLLTRILDSPVRGVVYEASGVVDEAVLKTGADQVARFCETSRIPYALLYADPADYAGWVRAAAAAVAAAIDSKTHKS